MPFGLLAAALFLPDPLSPPDFARFTRSASLIYVTQTVTIAVDGWNPKTKQAEYKVHYTWSQQIPAKRRDAEIDSRTCPAIRDMLASTRQIEMPKPAPSGMDDGRPMVLDGVFYELEAPSSFSNGQLTISSNMDSPLATWVDHALVTLAPCLPKATND